MSIDDRIVSHMRSLPDGFWDFKQEDVRVYTHGFHQYPAVMVCPISRHIISFMNELRPVGTLLDPFMGSGTVLVEGMLAGLRHVAGNDLNPMAVFMSTVKTTPVDVNVLRDCFDDLKDSYVKTCDGVQRALLYVDDYFIKKLKIDIFETNEWSKDASVLLSEYGNNNGINTVFPNIKNMGYWFKPRVACELSILRDIIFKIEDVCRRNFFLVALSECIRFVSNRRNGEFKMFRMPIEKLRGFNPDVWSVFSEIALRNINKMSEFIIGIKNKETNVIINYGDARCMESLRDDYYDLIITSPPYGDSRTTVAYGEFSRLSSAWLELMDEKSIMSLDRDLMGGAPKKNEVCFDLPSKTLNKSLEKICAVDITRCAYVYAFYRELNDAIAEIARKTRFGGYHFWVVGNRIVKKEKLLTDIIICELAETHGLAHVVTTGRAISNKVMPSRNSPTNEPGKQVETMTNEHIVVFRKI